MFRKKTPLLLVFIVTLASHVSVYADYISLTTEPDWVHQHLEDSSIVIVDVRPPEIYHKSHITGAVSIPVNQTFATGSRTGFVAPVSVIRDLLSNAGIQNESIIILYGDNYFKDVARMFWVLETFGLENVSVMNASFAKWQSMGFPISNKETHKPKSIVFPNVNIKYLATLLNVRAALDHSSHHQLIDARPKNEYLGLETKTTTYGHIPGAINVPYADNLSTDKTRLLSIEELEVLYKDIDKDKVITVYCNKGKQSAISYLSLRRIDKNVRHYDGSWFEWSLYSSLPIAEPD